MTVELPRIGPKRVNEITLAYLRRAAGLQGDLIILPPRGTSGGQQITAELQRPLSAQLDVQTIVACMSRRDIVI